MMMMMMMMAHMRSDLGENLIMVVYFVSDDPIDGP